MKKYFLILMLLIAGEAHMAEQIVKMETNYGTIELTLYSDQAPITVENFLTYANEGFYNGTIFHRVIDGFMVQGGGMTANLQPKKTHDPIRNESSNGLKNEIGTVAMARTADMNSATAQFFINVANNEFLDQKYCVFGKVSKGMDVVNKIKAVKTTTRSYYQDVPVEPVEIKSITVETASLKS